jgi:hypothetical protein
MDEIVKQAMAKWPNVPHCYGWLALDARGGWRMRDERAQALKLAGDRINNAALLGFINRNYTHDEQGRWYFQNGPQRVYIDLEATPYIVRTDPEHGYVLHTGEVLKDIDAAWMTEAGQLVLKSGEVIAQLDDRDMVQCLSRLRLDREAASDEALLAWLEQGRETGVLTFEHGGKQIVIQPILSASLSGQFGFEPKPSADANA